MFKILKIESLGPGIHAIRIEFQTDHQPYLCRLILRSRSSFAAEDIDWLVEHGYSRDDLLITERFTEEASFGHLGNCPALDELKVTDEERAILADQAALYGIHPELEWNRRESDIEPWRTLPVFEVMWREPVVVIQITETGAHCPFLN